MKKHITKLVAVLMAVLMMVSLVPAAALSDFNLPALLSVFGGNSATDNGAAANGNSEAAEAETAIPTEDGTPVSQAGGENLYMAADGTLYMDTDNDGTAEAITGDTVADEELPFNIQQGKVTNEETYNATKAINNGTTGTDSVGMVPKTLSAYEPTDTNNENHPFLPGGAAWIDLSKIYYGAPATQNYPLTKWSANTSVYNITEYGTYSSGKAGTIGEKMYAFRDLDLIDGYTWAGNANDPLLPSIRGSIDSTQSKYSMPFLTQKNGNTAYAYNRYDAMQGKYGITFDRNVKSAVWYPSWAQNYFPDASESDGFADLYNSVLYLSDTPYLYFSTEALDSTKIAISLLIGSPVQREREYTEADQSKAPGQTVATNEKLFEYRWYTITDNSDRPGISADSMNNSMVPIVTISDVVFTVSADGSNAYYQQTDAVGAALQSSGKTDPIAIATAKGIAKDSLYVNGSITGCIDFTNLLPALMSDDQDWDNQHKGREDIQYKVAQIRVDTETAENGTNSAFRMNYLYFGPSLSTVFSPQNTVGQNEDAESWRYKQTSTGNNGIDDSGVGAKANSTDERAYTNGWENGEAVSYVNTPNNPQLLTVDIHGKGDGKIVEWSSIPSGAALQGSTDTKVWKFTDKNGVVQYMEAERAGSSGSDYYVMVTVPVRKWINILGESRKISVTATKIHSGTNASLNPVFVLWGNANGSLGPGHANNKFGTRYRNEDLIMVFGSAGDSYHVDQSDRYMAAEVDRTIGEGVFWNAPGETKESWFDTLRSPYTIDRTVQGANSNYKYGTELVGYTFITSLRFSMPVGSAVSIQNMKGDGNSAGLNSYSTTGDIVNAYDGGTGEQPIVDIESSLPEKTVTVSGSGSTAADYTYTQANYGDNSIKGYITSGAAAYGPMLKESYYTIYDLLDTEMLWESGKESNHSSYYGKNKQPVYGQAWRADKVKNSSGNLIDLPIYHAPTTSGSKYGYVYANAQFIVYSTVIFSDESNSKWGMTGVLTKNGTTEIGWVQLWDGATSYASNLGGVLYSETKMKRSEYDTWYYPRNLSAALKNEWVISNFSTIDDGASFRDGTDSTFAYNSTFRNQTNSVTKLKFDVANNMYNKEYSGPQFKYANMWTGPDGHYSAASSMSDTYLRSVNGTDLEWGFKRKANTANNLSLSLTRILDTPIRLKQGKTHIHGSYPVLYLDHTSSQSFKIGLMLRVDGVDKLWYINSTNYMSPSDSSMSAGHKYAYLSFEDMMTKDFKGASTIEVTGINLYRWCGTSVSEANTVLRRLEIWQEETDWLDDIVAANQNSGGNTSTQMNAKVTDSMNIINDAFFNYHNESTDGVRTVTKKGTYASGTNIGINNADKGYEYTYGDNTSSETYTYWEGNDEISHPRTVSYRKTNSNKGWKAYIRMDTTKDGKVDSNDTTYYSYDGYTVDNAYEYVTSLGHLRVWGPADTQTSVVFESDRSFSTKNYRYLYYSYSMRDVDTGIAAEEPDTARNDGLKPGIAVSIKQNQLGSSTAYSEIVTDDGKRTWAFYDSGNPYWSEHGIDNRTFKTTINAAADLSSFDGIESVNQFVFYLNNPTNKTAEFYINYLYLSNTPPSDLIQNKMEEQQVQYYYLMDNTGDRYSARFPTIDNPSGAVSGLNCDNDRNNPIIVNRGARLSEGHYFNGDPLYGYGGTSSTNRTFNEETGSQGYYEKTYGNNNNPNGEANGSFKNIWFYAGDDGDSKTYTDIKDVYMYKQRNGTGEGTIYDMLWSYGRWNLGAGESGLNNMYIGQKNDPSVNETKDAVSGNLVRRYATENYVLLRSGIMPRRYQTYYDSSEGQFIYDNSNETLKDGIQLDENSYFITETVLYSQYTHPLLNSELNVPIKYGYTFDGWYTTDDIDVNQNGSEDQMFKYHRKQRPDINYFYAKWTEDSAYDNVENVATFYDINGKVWFTQTASRDTNDFKLVMPDTTQVAGKDGATVPIRGWRVKGDASGTVYAPGQKIVLQKSVNLEPVTSTTSETDISLTITLHSAELYLITEVDENGKYTGTLADIAKNHVKLNDYIDKGYHGIKITKSGSNYTYTNVPRDIILVAVPITKKTNGVWSIANAGSGGNVETEHINGIDYLNGASMTLVSTNNAEYQFSAYEDMEFTYSELSATNQAKYEDTNGAVSTMLSSTSTVKEQGVREMVFVSSFDLPAGATAKAWGTLYTKNMMYNRLGDATAQDKAMRLDETSINATTIEKGSFATANSNVRQVKATSKSKSNQYYLRVTEIDGKKVWYFARSYVIYELSGKTYVAYSSVVRKEVLDAVEISADL